MPRQIRRGRFNYYRGKFDNQRIYNDNNGNKNSSDIGNKNNSNINDYENQLCQKAVVDPASINTVATNTIYNDNTNNNLSRQQRQYPQQNQQRLNRKPPNWSNNEELKLIEYLCSHYDQYKQNKPKFFRKLSEHSEQIFEHKRRADQIKGRFTSLMFHYRNKINIFNAIEQFLDLEQKIEKGEVMAKKVDEKIKKDDDKKDFRQNLSSNNNNNQKDYKNKDNNDYGANDYIKFNNDNENSSDDFNDINDNVTSSVIESNYLPTSSSSNTTPPPPSSPSKVIVKEVENHSPKTPLYEQLIIAESSTSSQNQQDNHEEEVDYDICKKVSPTTNDSN
ncbi:5135_t:CDS:1, partial [Entrophospora sp. SA101]